MLEQCPDVMTKEMLAEILHCKVASVYEACRNRSQSRNAVPLPFFRLFNGQLRFRKTAIVAWLEKLSAERTQ